MRMSVTNAGKVNIYLDDAEYISLIGEIPEKDKMKRVIISRVGNTITLEPTETMAGYRFTRTAQYGSMEPRSLLQFNGPENIGIEPGRVVSTELGASVLHTATGNAILSAVIPDDFKLRKGLPHKQTLDAGKARNHTEVRKRAKQRVKRAKSFGVANMTDQGIIEAAKSFNQFLDAQNLDVEVKDGKIGRLLPRKPRPFTIF